MTGISSSRLRDLLISAIIVIISVLLYSIVLTTTISPELTEFFRIIEPWMVFALILFLYPVYRRSGWIGELWSLATTAILFAMPLSWVWSTGNLDGNVIGGLLPWSDANGYFGDAQRLLIGERLSDFASRRPLFAGTFSLLLALTRHNLQLSLAILGFITAFSCYILARKIRRAEGPFVGVIVLAVSFLYYRIFIGKVLTEHLGLTFGALGLAFIWQGAHDKKKWSLLGGIFLLALALNARAGAFFVLPALVIWGTWFYRDRRLFSRWFLIGSTLAILSAFLLNSLLLNVIGSLEGKAFANFSYTLYGLAAGYKGWMSAKTAYPQETDIEIYQYAFDLIRANPRGLLIGIALAYQDFLNPRSYNAFRFMHIIGRNSSLTYMVLFLISGLGIVWGLLNFKKWRGSLLIALTLGVWFSIPFAPPIDSDFMRVYAATIPIIGLLLGFGAVAPLRWLMRDKTNKSLPYDRLDGLTAPFAAALVAICVLGPLLIYSTGGFPTTTPQATTCKPGFDPLVVYVNQGTIIHLVKSNKVTQSMVPYLSLDDFRARFDQSSYKNMAKELEKLTSGNSILVSLDYQESTKTDLDNLFLIANTNQIPRHNGLTIFCAKITENEALRRYSFYYTQDALEGKRSAIDSFGPTPNQISRNSLLIVALVVAMILESLISIIREVRTNLKLKRENLNTSDLI